jgi:hypothetical protein
LVSIFDSVGSYEVRVRKEEAEEEEEEEEEEERQCAVITTKLFTTAKPHTACICYCRKQILQSRAIGVKNEE